MGPTTLETPCREWQGSKNEKGYGQRRVAGRVVKVHRWVAAQVHGWDAIDGKVVMHLCDNRACFRYDHLVIGSQAENLADMRAKGRDAASRQTHCKHGHEFTDENTCVSGGKRNCRACISNRRKRSLSVRYR